MLAAFFSGFFISLSLILAIGPQNSLVIRQGLLNQHVGAVVLFCGLSDAVLICLGVLGLGSVMAPVFTAYSDWFFGFSACWLGCYGLSRLRAAYQKNYPLDQNGVQVSAISLRSIFGLLAVMTFANPHVYLDTVILLGTISISYMGSQKIAFACGAALASFSFFAAIGFGARTFSAFMRSQRAWQYLDMMTAGVMFVFAITLLVQTSWLDLF